EEPQNSESGIIDLISEETIVFWVGVEEIEGRIKKFRERASNAYKQGMSRNNLPVKDLYLTTEYIKGKSLNNCQISWHELGRGSQVDLDFNGRFPDSFPHTVERFPEHIDKYCQRDYKVWICADTTGEKDRLEELLFDSKVEKARLVTPTLSAGFVLSEEKMAILTSNELFMRRRMRARHTRFRRRTVVFDRSSLKRGDLVVHADYGIGKYEGLQKVKVRDHPRECLRIKYADDTILYIKVEHFGLVEKYTRMDNANPALSKINSREWERAKKKTKKAIEDIAGELVRLYAKRKIAKGVAFSVDSLWQGEMESSFEFEDTPDQVTSIVEIKKDLELSSPMDRLLCGDVGFGKTEVAIRAAFKVVQDSHQVAILVPTTILAQQHYETFRERLASYPVRIEVLSRFRSRSEQKDTVKDLALGKVDILIGTHRLLSKDVGFKELGLLVIDEEHRFGVKHKERLKSLKTNVDVLTMTATPIPRTLHMALMGARDTSQINTPPIDRLPIQTEVYSWSEKLIKDAILREVDRNGQVFFVHNRVQSILAVKGMLERIVPGINYGVAHGQMPERQLEKIMFEFMHGRYDVLITTMIIESGLDIPNANTLIVNRADRFGLAQLYQLRGRIGRSNRQAYAYLLTPPKLTVAGLARKRLSTLTELTDLGSGFKIAMRDLELRGAGNLLGAQQSGFINAIGFSLYTRILNDVIQKLKGEAPSRSAKSESEEIKIEFIGPALFPSTYIEDSDTRYNFYKKLSNVKDISEIDEIENELVDRFGSIPEKADNLLSLARIKAMGRILNFSRIMFRQTYLSCQIDLPSDLTESQKILGKIVSQAAPEQIEFKMGKKVEIIHRYKLKDHLKASLKFLRHLSRKGILQD
ncbi:transcription-repair coupling factor, partial [bacterium]|nr:transcription-repair coupling factor [bacterium]